MIVARVAFRNEAEEWIDSSLPRMAGEFVGLRVAVEMPSGRIRSVVVYFGQLERRRVDPRGVPTTVLHQDGMIRHGAVEIVDVKWAIVRGFGVVVLEA